jgi:hypothetical protein
MLKIKKQYLNAKVSRGQDVFILSEDSSEQTLQYLYNMIGSEYIEKIESPLPEIKKKKK